MPATHTLPPLPEEEELWAPSARKGSKEKESSLTYLAESVMLELDNKRPPHQFSISELARSCRGDIKRVYTICNVFEGLEGGLRKGKDMFEWRGFGGMESCLARLKGRAVERGLGSKYFSLLNREQQQQSSTSKEGQVKMNVTMITQSLLMLLTVVPKGTVLEMRTAAALLLGGSTSPSLGYSAMKLREVGHVLQALLLVQTVTARPCVGLTYSGPHVEATPGGQRMEMLKGLELLEAEIEKDEGKYVSVTVIQLDEQNHVLDFKHL